MCLARFSAEVFVVSGESALSLCVHLCLYTDALYPQKFQVRLRKHLHLIKVCNFVPDIT